MCNAAPTHQRTALLARSLCLCRQLQACSSFLARPGHVVLTSWQHHAGLAACACACSAKPLAHCSARAALAVQSHGVLAVPRLTQLMRVHAAKSPVHGSAGQALTVHHPGALPAEYILTAEGAGTPFSVISPLRSFADGTRLYKLFSRAPLAQEQLGALVTGAVRVAERDWTAAYPVFGAPERFAPFQLAQVTPWDRSVS